jgi:deoxyribodipyrimidine photo-lyase
MQANHRVEHNWALTYAIELANKMDIPVVVYFGLTPDFPEANQRHYWFMLEGLAEVCSALVKMGIKFVVKIGSLVQNLIELSKKASLVVVDKGYLKTNKSWYKLAAETVPVSLIQVEDNLIVPVEEASDKEEYSAATLRPKLLAKLNDFLDLPGTLSPNRSSMRLKLESVDISDTHEALSAMSIDRTINKSSYFVGGTSKAKALFEFFYQRGIETYEETGGNPENNVASNLSPYLHFGQISPIYIALKILKTNFSESHRFLEQLIVRRELAINFVNYNPNYDSFLGLPKWAQETLSKHQYDLRIVTYSLQELENGVTHDAYWNAAQREMVKTGKMNGYMRMYWGKKIIEWTQNPQTAFTWALYLNNKYEIDGRDPNGYAGVAWCFGKHDRPWKNRAIFGNVRFMNDKGLERKFDMTKYLYRVNALV